MKRYMNKIFAVLTAILLLSSCSGFAGENGANGGETDGFYFKAPTAGGTGIRIGDDMSEVLASLGEPLKYFEAASCAFNGLDKTYTYSGFVITTRPDGERDLVNSILLTDDSASTVEGVYIGCSAERAADAYPSCEKLENVIRAEKGGTAINMIIKDGAVISIEYIPA
ncbi:MAG: hypothetical protein IKX86_06450 [Clostridia bacterium]|nr:hypothetical protein [Clostridia bacterium]MBR5768294.1 hypothetical protein [Clostridia bacterium]